MVHFSRIRGRAWKRIKRFHGSPRLLDKYVALCDGVGDTDTDGRIFVTRGKNHVTCKRCRNILNGKRMPSARGRPPDHLKSFFDSQRSRTN